MKETRQRRNWRRSGTQGFGGASHNKLCIAQTIVYGPGEDLAPISRFAAEVGLSRRALDVLSGGLFRITPTRAHTHTHTNGKTFGKLSSANGPRNWGLVIFREVDLLCNVSTVGVARKVLDRDWVVLTLKPS